MFLVVKCQLILRIFFRVTPLALGQSYDCHSASEVTLNDMNKQINKVSFNVLC